MKCQCCEDWRKVGEHECDECGKDVCEDCLLYDERTDGFLCENCAEDL